MASSRDRQAGAPAVKEFVIRVRMLAEDDVSDEFLEELTILVEGALTESAAEIAPGASAAANFATRMIELDFIVEAQSPEEAHQKVGEVVGIAMGAVSPRQTVAFAGSQTSAVPVPA